MDLRTATAELHSKAEKMEFNQRMIRGELSIEEYVSYLESQHAIFDCIERLFILPYPGLRRSFKVSLDLQELGATIPVISEKTQEYVDYLSTLSNYTSLPHIYLNYLALVYGGQMMKQKIHGSGRMYDFDDMQTCIGSIRRHQRDDWADEVNKGFEFIINILDELQNTSRSNSQ